METKNWKWFRYDEIFEIKHGFYNKKPDNNPDGKIPFVGATDSNNGVTSYSDIDTIKTTSKTGDENNAPLEDKIFEKCIAVTNNGSVGYAYYQDKLFTCTHDVNPIYLKGHQINKYIALFLCTVIEKDRFRWAYGRKWRPKRMPSSLIKLPVNTSGNPDWQWIENYVQNTLIPKLPQKTKKVWQRNFDTTPLSPNKLQLKTKEWQWFTIDDGTKNSLFSVAAGKYHYPSEYSNGNTPYLSATAVNNGVGNKIDLDAEFEGNVVTTEKVGCTSFYQPKPFCATSDVNIITCKRHKINPYIGLFLASVIDFNENFRWTYGRQCRVGDTKAIRIKLPATKNAQGEYEPDWQWMEDYIKGLPYSGCL